MAKVDRGSYCSFAACTMLSQLEELETELDGAREQDDIEFVHRSRVASRRLRASLTIFADCCPPDEHKAWVRAIKRVTRSLGAARDLDVQIEFLHRYIDKEVGDASLHRLLSGLCRKRKQAQKDVVGSLEELKSSPVSDGIRNWSSKFDLRGKTDLRDVRRIGLINVLARLDELYAFESYVEDPNAVTKHHEMRIAGKHLRYTVEIFAKGFKGGLKARIKRLKEMQDVLGEMHDCDVWTELLKNRRGVGAQRLLAERTARRVQLHEDFVKIWSGMKERHLPGLEKTMREAATDNGIDLEGHHGPIGLIADVHGNLPALLAVLRDAEESGVTVFLNSGDSVGPSPFNRETVGELMFRGITSVIGNFDREILAPWSEHKKDVPNIKVPKTKIARKIVSELEGPEVEWMKLLPQKTSMCVAGKKLLLTHGSPASIDEKVTIGTSDERLKVLSSMASADIVVLGHSHMPLDREIDNVRFIDPGSVGRQVDGDPRASYAIWDPMKGVVDFRRVAYPVHEVLDRMVERGWPKDAGTIHLRGSSSDEPDVSPNETERALWAEMAISVAKINAQYDEHPRFVRDLSVVLFDKLRRVLGLVKDDLALLECAAIMHDIGWAWGGKGHHKSSFDLIMMSPLLKIPYRDKLMIANIARYHRGGSPKGSHGNLLPLERSDLERMKKLASLLRIADGLDNGHTQRMSVRNVRIIKGSVRIELEDKERSAAEIALAMRKADMLQDIIGMEILIG